MNSKRRFATRPPPDDAKKWVFFTDRDLGKSIPHALRAKGFRVERHDDHFTATTPDEIWIPDVAARGWVALSHNKAIRRVALQRDAAMQSASALFMLIGKRHDELEKNLIVTMPRIIQFREKHEPPFIAHVTRPAVQAELGIRPGNVQMKLSIDQWKAGPR